MTRTELESHNRQVFEDEFRRWQGVSRASADAANAPKIAALEEQMEHLKSELRDIGKDAETLNAQYTKLTAEIDRLEAQAQKEPDIRKQTKILDRSDLLQQKQAEMSADIEETAAEFNGVKREIAKLRAEIASLQSGSRAKDTPDVLHPYDPIKGLGGSSRKKIEARIEAIEDELEALEKKIDSASPQEKPALEKHVDKLEAERDKLEEKLHQDQRDNWSDDRITGRPAGMPYNPRPPRGKLSSEQENDLAHANAQIDDMESALMIARSNLEVVVNRQAAIEKEAVALEVKRRHYEDLVKRTEVTIEKIRARIKSITSGS